MSLKNKNVIRKTITCTLTLSNVIAPTTIFALENETLEMEAQEVITFNPEDITIYVDS